MHNTICEQHAKLYAYLNAARKEYNEGCQSQLENNIAFLRLSVRSEARDCVPLILICFIYWRQ